MANIVEDSVVLENITISFSTEKDEDGNDIETVSVIARGYSGDSSPPPLIKVRDGVVNLDVPTTWKNKIKEKAETALKEYFDIT